MMLLSSASAVVHGAVHRGTTPVISPGPKVARSGSTFLNGTAHGTFFAHGDPSNPNAPRIYSLFASGRIPPVGPTLLVGGFQTSGFTASGAGGGNLIFEFESLRGNLDLRLTETSGTVPSSTSSRQYVFTYEITHGSGAYNGARGAGTVTITLQPNNTNIHGQPASNPGFFGNSTLTFHAGPTPSLVA